MSKAGKRVKSGTAPSGGSKWDNALQTTPLEEDRWKANITFVVGNAPEDYSHIKLLGSAVAGGTRKLFSLISKNDLYQEVNELGNPKAKKTKEVPANFEVCEACKLHLDIGDEIPLPLLAKLIKYRLLTIKTKDQKRREIEKKAALKPSEAANDQAKGKKDKGKERGKSPGKKGGGKKTPEPPAAKEGSKLRKRGEEDQESKFIDDEPDDGAQHYIIIYGFHQPHLFTQLAEIGVNADSILRVSTQDYSIFDVPAADKNAEKDEKTIQAELAAKEEKNDLKKELKKFWKDILLVLQKNGDASKLHDVAIEEYEIKTLLMPANLEDPEQKLTFSTTIFEDVACKIYDLIDAKRLYHNYLENLKLVPIPVIGQPVAPAIDGQSTASATTPAPQTAPPISATTLPPDGQIDIPVVDMRYYNDLMSCIPQESVSVPLILHSMLEQVVAVEENKNPPSELRPSPRSDGLNNELASYLSSMAFKLALSEDEHKMLEETMDLPKMPSHAPKQPLLMNYHDKNTVRTHKLQTEYGFDPQATEEAMLQFSPFSNVVKLERPTTAIAKERAARLQELIHFCATGIMSHSEIDRAFKQFLFECMDLTSTDANGFIMTREGEGLEHTAIPWDDPYPFFKGMIPHHEKHLDIPVLSSDGESVDKTPGPEARSSRVGFTDSGTADKNDTTTSNRSRPTSSESKKGILKPRSRSQSPVRELRSRSNSVHFIKDEGQPLPLSREEEGEFEDVEEEVEEKTIEDSMMEVVDAQKRTLDEWCYAEHFDAKVLLQILNEASYILPFTNTYYNKRDHSMMLILHSPYNAELQNHVDWHTELHSNMGFRNYMEYVKESIDEWLKEKQAEYDAKMLSQEVEKLQADDDAAAKAAERQKLLESPKKTSRGGRSKSPKSPRSNSQEKSPTESSNKFIRAGSLKAQQEEADRIKAEEDEKQKQLQQKRSKSPQKKDEKEEKEKKRPGSRGSAKSKTSQKDIEPQTESLPLELHEEEKYWPFKGYDVGNNLVHVSGIVTSLFPSDGGQIRIERTEFVQGTTSINSTVLKDGHVFAVHILNPIEDECESDTEEDENGSNKVEGEEKKDLPEKSEFEKLEKEELKDLEVKEKKVIKSSFGSVTATLNDGMTLAVSQFGPTGEATEGKKYEPEPYIPPVTSPSPTSQPASPGKTKKGSGDKGKEKGAPTPEPPQIQTEDPDIDEDKKDDDKVIKQSFQELYLTCPDGLNVRYFLESSLGIKPNSEMDRRLVVKQSYPFKTKGIQPCESKRKKYMLTEASRVITSDGTIVKNMVDGTVEVLYADGTVSNHTGKWQPTDSRNSSPQRAASGRSGNDTPTKKNIRSKGSSKNLSPKKQEENKVQEIEEKAKWVTTYPNGERYSVRSDGTVEDLKPVMICLASDPETKQSMATRDDRVITVSYPDGTTIVEHSDGTRITTYYCESQVAAEDEDADETGETPTSETRITKFVKVECPAYATVEFNCLTSENLTIFGNNTSVNVFPDGFYMLQHADGGRLQVDTEGTLIYYPRPDQIREDNLTRELQYVLRHNADVVCETVDSEGNVFNVKHTGDFSVMLADGDDCVSSEASVEESVKIQEKITNYSQHSPRFFIVHADGSGTELLRPQDVAEYLTQAENSPATAVCKDPIPDYPGVMGITVLKPFIGGPSEIWLKKYDLDSIIPNGIRSRDLTNLPPKEFKQAGPRFGTNVGHGLAVGSAIKSPTRVAIVKCPDVLELRQLVQYNPVSEKLRIQLYNGLREYAEYVMERNKVSQMMQVNDPRGEDEQNLASDLNSTVAVENQPTYDPSTVKELYEKTTAPPVPSPPPTPMPKRTQADWERDQREIIQELEGRTLLKNKTIPPYFQSELGKAFLITQAKTDDDVLQELSEDPRRDGTEAIRGDTSSLSYGPQSQTPTAGGRQTHSQPAIHSENSDQSVASTCMSPTLNGASQASVKLETPISSNTVFSTDITATPSGLRPLNPTPAHATGQGSPAPVRPNNPTPNKTGKSAPHRPGNPTPKNAGSVTLTPSDSDHHTNRKSQMTIQEEDATNMWMSDVASRESDVFTRSLKLNVTGEPRTDSVSLPESIMGARPGAEKNIRFLEIEEPVRRKVNNTVIAGANEKGRNQLEKMRGLSLLPDKVNFGVLREGYTYSYSVYLKNTGVDTCRFKVKQPPPATGLKVIFKPGPVAAGMRTELHLELYAIAVGVEGESGVGGIQHDLQIVTETDSLSLPIRATILTAHEYERKISQGPMGYQRTAGAQLISTKPPSSTGIIRPRKDNMPIEMSA
ncbi:sperm-associated antigen 17 isoform X2 [Patella vulgata]|uniref:sperm-associated antigen 17 isoform X2 n=1 Tax=Patella vulgata TaxID=6465 RepID=UPI00217FC813|nr:sperm-associated antigen 17 isoform X2 [Patella vulgata]